MGVYTIKNGELAAILTSEGAELQSLRDCRTRQEYMWNADPKYWKATSPILFPVVGMCRNQELRCNGRTYSMPPHGFAWNKGFETVSVSQNEILFALESDPETMRCYPFPFRLEDGYLRIAEDLFDQDALVVENHQVQRVSLCTPDRRPYVTVSFLTPVFGIWSLPHKGAPFVCIEPWYGRCDRENFQGTLQEREWGNTLGVGDVFEAGYGIEV